MDLNMLFTELNDDSNEAAQLAAIDRLQTMADDDRVVEALCSAAVSSPAARVREKIIEMLQPRAAEAVKRFIRAARRENDHGSRRLALVNLSLMGCDSPEAREVALQGLQDPDPDIQHAAALCAGYFDDPPFLGALAHYLEANRFAVACAGIHRQIFRHRMARRPDKVRTGEPQPSTE